MRHGVIIAVVGIIIFIGFGAVVLASGTNCGLGPAADDPEANETSKRSDDQAWFSHFVCTGSMAKHNR
jgi:hypothetical protein